MDVRFSNCYWIRHLHICCHLRSQLNPVVLSKVETRSVKPHLTQPVFKPMRLHHVMEIGISLAHSTRISTSPTSINLSVHVVPY